MKKRLLCLCLAISIVAGLFVFAPVAAASDMKASEVCLGLIKEFEGFSGKPYRDTDGHYTIGYGTRCPADLVEFYTENPMSQEEADLELRKEMVTYEKAVNSFIDRHKVEFTQQQFDALVSLVYNVGPSWLTKGTTLINALVNGATGNELIYAFTIYSMSGGNRSLGHIKRRLAEANVYLNAVYSRTLPDNLAYVIYDGRGGEVSSYNVQGYDTNLTAVPVVVATREGYEFKGWYADTNATEPVTVLDASTRNLTLFARWEPVEGTDPEDQPGEGAVSVTVTGDDVNVRRGPGLGYGIVGKAHSGDRLTITEVIDNEGYTWGCFDKGWIALEYTDYFQNQAKPCSHEYITVSSKAPTCTEEGLTVRSCKLCGETDSQILAATGHSFAGQSCTEAKTCKVCGLTSGTALGHQFTAATCTTPKTCTVCGKTEGTALGHKYSAATCTEPKTCSVCGKTEGPALGHSYSGPTCTTAIVCKTCGKTKGFVLGHSFTAATCTTPAKCTICGITQGSALGHEYGSDGVCGRCGGKDPSYKGVTVTVTGTGVNLRSGAGLSYQRVGSVSTGVKLVITETKQKDGYLWGESDRGWIALKYTNYNQVVKPCSHSYAVTSRKEATCTAQGSVTYTCKSCGHSYVETVAAKAHSFSAATCTKAKTCKVCGTTSGSALGHSYSEATCTAARKCGRCGATTGSALGHKYGDNGLCSRCGGKDPNYKEPEKPESTTKIYATIVNTDTLNVRKSPNGTIIGVLYSGDRVEILEQKTVDGCLWGRCEKGWIYIHSYGKLETVTGDIDSGTTSKPDDDGMVTVVRTYATVINTDSLNVRKSPNGTLCGTLKGGERVEILEQKLVDGRLWGRCEKGWIFIHTYGELETIVEKVPADQITGQTGKVTATALNIRAGAGTNYAVVGMLYQGNTVVILEKKTVNGTVWARIDRGWVSMTYIK